MARRGSEQRDEFISTPDLSGLDAYAVEAIRRLRRLTAVAREREDWVLGSAGHADAGPRGAGAGMVDGMANWRDEKSRTPGTDAPLTVRARCGDGEAFSVLVRRHDPAMRRLAFRLLGSVDAMEDALQEAYIKAFRALASYREDAEFGSWLYRVTYNACLDELRRARRRPLGRPTIDDVESFAPGPERAVTTADAVRTALAALPVEQRATVVLVDGEGFDNQTAARLLGVAPGTVASRLSRARAALRRALEGVHDDRA